MIHINNYFNSHLINVTIDGHYYGHDYDNSASNGIASTRDTISHTYLSHKDIGNSFKLGDIDRSTESSIASNSITTSDFVNISGY